MERQTSNKIGKEKIHANATDSSTKIRHHPPRVSSPLNPYSASSIPPPMQPVDSQPRPTPKVAIPRLRRDSEDQLISKAAATGDKHRVTHACEPCRHRKTKCSGDRPVCRHCQDHRLICVYEDGKRDRVKKQLGNLASRVEEYEHVLEDLSTRVGDEDRGRIRATIDKEAYSEDDDVDSVFSPRKTNHFREPAGEFKVTARVGSTESLDRISEDFDSTPATRATGFHGKNSDITWLQRLNRTSPMGNDNEDAQNSDMNEQTSPVSRSQHPGATGRNPISQSSYHCDDIDITIAEEVDRYAVPSPVTVDKLFNVYMDTVHPSFPIISKTAFSEEYHEFARGERVRPNWLAILNLIFAIGAKHSHLVQAEWRGDVNDHLVYFTRARLLGFNENNILGHADLQRVQITGLMTFYLMAINQINRSWVASGIAMRHATTLGLNLRNESKDVDETPREIRYRVWWALCSVERRLAVMTGRPTSFAETDCTAPLPLPLEEDSLYNTATASPQAIKMLRRLSSQESRPNDIATSTPSSSHSSKARGSPVNSSTSLPPTLQSSSYDLKQSIPTTGALAFLFHTKLSTFTNEVLTRLYRANAMKQSWAQVQNTIASLNSRLEEWLLQLPNVFDFTKKQRDQEFSCQRMSLGFFYYSTAMIINRPCLCRIDGNIPNESSKARDFNRETAARCVHAARDMLKLLPDTPNPKGLYKVGPWWCLVHYLMQAATILMLELSFRADHMPTEVEELFDCAKKALVWLSSMAEDDEAARRASVLCAEGLRKVAPKVGRNPSDVTNYPKHQSRGAENLRSPQSSQTEQSIAPTQHYQQPYLYTTSGPFQPPIYGSYDHAMFYGNPPTTSNLPNSSGASYEDMFPTAHDMENMRFDDPQYFQGQDPRWFPGSGGSA